MSDKFRLEVFEAKLNEWESFRAAVVPRESDELSQNICLDGKPVSVFHRQTTGSPQR